MDIKKLLGMGKPDIKKMEKDKDIKGLMNLLKYTNDESVRRDAAFAIDKITDSSITEHPNLNEENSYLQSKSEEYEGEIGENSVEKLIDSLKDEDWNVRKTVPRLLAKLVNLQLNRSLMH
ncbi:HEAT repeat domain-containing protein [Methanobacterium spitsbergense]|uniref:HEAT repeat domain-containing protein n=1 Tax=Methanobacterium spitsbergense TaxID=2874285 RepID=A0A8T5UNN8_9EURY|nr:HEAT repeat domain-containing protein [Methanobacterium spitsbergense]MBZ2165428.1 hypothetical protein [Methanobacterium spitsbergense]